MTKTGFRLEAFDWENLSVKNACALVFSGRRALDTGHGGFREFARSFPGACQRLPEAGKLQKFGSKRLPAKNGRFPIVPEGTFNCRPGSPQIAKFWLQKVPNRSNQSSSPRVGTHMRSSMVGYPSACLEEFF